MNVASADTIAQRVFLEGLRDNPVALRSRMDRDDIEKIEIVPVTDLDVAATRQVLKVGGADRTGEIDASDVLEAIDIVDVMLPPAPAFVPPAFVAPAPYGTSIEYEDDAYYATVEHVSTNAVTFDSSEELEPEQQPELLERRSLGWIVATVLAAAAALVIGAVVAEHFPAGASATASTVAPPPSPRAPAALPSPWVPTPANAPGATASMSVNALRTAAVPTIDVKNLPPAAVGTIVGPRRHPFFIDGARATSSTAVVACGKHTVKIGTSRKTHVVDVPCDGQIAIR